MTIVVTADGARIRERQGLTGPVWAYGGEEFPTPHAAREFLAERLPAEEVERVDVEEAVRSAAEAA